MVFPNEQHLEKKKLGIGLWGVLACESCEVEQARLSEIRRKAVTSDVDRVAGRHLKSVNLCNAHISHSSIYLGNLFSIYLAFIMDKGHP